MPMTSSSRPVPRRGRAAGASKPAQADAFFRQIVAGMRNGVLAITRAGTVALLNEEGYRIFGVVPHPDDLGKPVAEVAATYFAAGAYFKLDRIVGAARGINVSDYFDRLALDRALDSIGAAERRLAAEMVANGAAGAAAVEVWVAARQGEVNRILAAVDEIAGSGLTLSKLSVAASLLGYLVKH